ncbi:MAG: hypothetical protein EA423_01600 [Phycisphaerales bacterium]|nr:MAG: hypothetical protein EA423_01600 [Phycisphaerales bacterium]
MLLTLSTACVRDLVMPKGRRKPEIQLLDLPAYANEQLGLHGLVVTTDLLKGADRARVEALRERADKAGCACLVLVESDPQPLADPNDDKGEKAIERTEKVISAAAILGCNAAAIEISGPDREDTFELAIDRLQIAVERAEKLEMNLLISPGPGLTADAERVTELIKRVARFRVMTYPDFQKAAESGDPVSYLRRLTPYAGAVCASTVEFAPEKEPDGGADDLLAALEGLDDPEHSAYDLNPMIEAVRAVGFDGSVALDYRGEGDVTLGLLKSRAAVEAALVAAEEQG